MVLLSLSPDDGKLRSRAEGRNERPFATTMKRREEMNTYCQYIDYEVFRVRNRFVASVYPLSRVALPCLRSCGRVTCVGLRRGRVGRGSGTGSTSRLLGSEDNYVEKVG